MNPFFGLYDFHHFTEHHFDIINLLLQTLHILPHFFLFGNWRKLSLAVWIFFQNLSFLFQKKFFNNFLIFFHLLLVLNDLIQLLLNRSISFSGLLHNGFSNFDKAGPN